MNYMYLMPDWMLKKFSLKIAGAKLWNVLSNHIKESSSIDILKQKLKNYLIDNMLLG